MALCNGNVYNMYVHTGAMIYLKRFVHNIFKHLVEITNMLKSVSDY